MALKRSKDGSGNFVCHTTHTLHGSGDSHVTHLEVTTSMSRYEDYYSEQLRLENFE